MPRQLHWRELTAGIIAVAAIAVLVMVTLVFARVGGLHGDKVTLYVVTDAATGVLKGTEVWLSGQEAGLVKDVSFRATSTDTLERLIIRIELLEAALPSVRRDSYAQIRPSGSFLGKRIIFIASGSFAIISHIILLEWLFFISGGGLRLGFPAQPAIDALVRHGVDASRIAVVRVPGSFEIPLLARRLAELHGGSLHIDSARGRGTTVTVTLPAVRASEKPGALLTAESLAGAA